MIKEEIAIVLGAGASTTFKLPLGAVLRDDIARSLDIKLDTFGSTFQSGSLEIIEALKVLARSKGQSSTRDYANAGREISEALPLCASIDDVVERHAGKEAYSVCAKLAISEAILKYERKSGLCRDQNRIADPDISLFDGKWISSLLQLITRGCSHSDLPEAFSRLKVIIFNYDRCFEHFSFLWLKRVYRLSDQEAAACLEKATIVHPYGSVGKLPFQMPNRGTPIGKHNGPADLLDISTRIYTYSEYRESILEKSIIDKMIEESRVLIFFGFAFHPQNIKMLSGSGERPFHTRHVYSTDVDMPEPRWNAIKDRMSACLNVDSSNLFMHRAVDSCENLIKEFAEDWAEY